MPAARPGSNTPGHLPYSVPVLPPSDGDDWVGLSSDDLPLDLAPRWAVVPSCGAVVTFSGHARDHSAGRPGVSLLDYEAYDEQVEPALRRLAAEMRRRWPDLGRVVLLHRVGELGVTDAAVVVVVSAPHRDVAFDAARFGIDTLKSSTPIWKREVWEDGESWGLEAQHLSSSDAP